MPSGAIRDEFLAPLRQTLSVLLSVEGDSISPILEGVQVAAVSAFQPREADIPRQVLVVSDMIQNSRNLSFYRDPVDFGPLSRNPDYGTLRVDLTGVEVSVFLLARRGGAGRIQGGTLRRFWEDYFLDQGASTPRPAEMDHGGRMKPILPERSAAQSAEVRRLHRDAWLIVLGSAAQSSCSGMFWASGRGGSRRCWGCG